MKEMWNKMNAEQRAKLIKEIYGEYAWSNYYSKKFEELNIFLQKVLMRLEKVLAV